MNYSNIFPVPSMKIDVCLYQIIYGREEIAFALMRLFPRVAHKALHAIT